MKKILPLVLVLSIITVPLLAWGWGDDGEEVNWKTLVLTATTILGVGIVFI